MEWRSRRLLEYIILSMYPNGTIYEGTLIYKRIEMLKRELNLADEDLRRIADEIHLKVMAWFHVRVSDEGSKVASAVSLLIQPIESI